MRDAVLIIVATEGAITEGIYFSMFRSSRVQVKVVPTKEGKSSPAHVYARLKEFQSQYDISDGDELWLAIDRDRWTPHGLKRIAADCFREKIGLALSNPCFEIWLAMHFGSAGSFPEKLTSKEAEVILKSLFPGYNKNNFDISQLRNKISHANIVAKELDINKKSRWPNKTGSRIYKIVDSIEKQSKKID